MWAPLSSPSLSARISLITDPGIAKFKDKFVWLAMEVDAPSNPDALSGLLPAASGIFLLAADSTVLDRHLGSASLYELQEFLKSASGEPATESPQSMASLARKGHALRAKGAIKPALKAYQKALKLRGPEESTPPQLQLAMVESLHRQQKWKLEADEHSEYLALLRHFLRPLAQAYLDVGQGRRIAPRGSGL